MYVFISCCWLIVLVAPKGPATEDGARYFGVQLGNARTLRHFRQLFYQKFPWPGLRMVIGIFTEPGSRTSRQISGGVSQQSARDVGEAFDVGRQKPIDVWASQHPTKKHDENKHEVPLAVSRGELRDVIGHPTGGPGGQPGQSL